MNRRPFKASASLIAVGALLATGALWSNASGQDSAPTTLTFKELERGSTFTHIRNTRTNSRRANSAGDLLVFTNRLADTSGRRIGKLSVSCTTTTGSRNFTRSTLTCIGVVALRDGTLTLQGDISPGKRTNRGAVTGGTGAYANARGVIVSTTTSTGANDTITFGG